MVDRLEFVRWFQLQSENFEQEVWPPYSSDLNTLVICHDAGPSKEPYEIKETFKGVAHMILEQMIREAVENVRKRCQACKAASGGHLEAFLKQF